MLTSRTDESNESKGYRAVQQDQHAGKHIITKEESITFNSLLNQVAVVWLLDTVHQVVVVWSIYSYLITGWDKLDSLIVNSNVMKVSEHFPGPRTTTEASYICRLHFHSQYVLACAH